MNRARFSLGLLLGISACLSPTLPLPPPEEPNSIAISSDPGIFEVRGSNTPGSVVLIKNLNTGIITGNEDKDSDGRYFIRVAGELCDGAEVYEIIGNDTSDTTFFVLDEVVNGEPVGDCSR